MYHTLERFISQIAEHFQYTPCLSGPCQIYVGESLSVFFHCVDKYQIVIFQIMILEFIAAIFEQDILNGYNHDELVSLRTTINNTELIVLLT